MAEKSSEAAGAKGQKLRGFKSLATLVVLAVIISMFGIALVAEIVNVVEFRANYKETVQNDLLTMVKIGGALMDAKELQIDADPSVLDGMIGDIKLEHADSSCSIIPLRRRSASRWRTRR